MVLLISYDLNGRERPSSYTKVKNYIEQHAISYNKPLYSQWLIETNSTAQNWVDAIRSNADLDDNDLIFAVEVRRPYAGWLQTTTWNWLSARL